MLLFPLLYYGFPQRVLFESFPTHFYLRRLRVAERHHAYRKFMSFGMRHLGINKLYRFIRFAGIDMRAPFTGYVTGGGIVRYAVITYAVVYVFHGGRESYQIIIHLLVGEGDKRFVRAPVMPGKRDGSVVQSFRCGFQ